MFFVVCLMSVDTFCDSYGRAPLTSSSVGAGAGAGARAGGTGLLSPSSQLSEDRDVALLSDTDMVAGPRH